MEFGEVVRLARPRPGHFDLGTGYHGDLWLDLDALFLRPSRLRPHVRWLGERLKEHAVDAVCGPLEGGAFLAYAVADLLGVAFLPGYRSPGETTGYHLPAVPGGIDGWRVAVVDDAVNAGTAVAACLEELRGRGAVPVAVAALMALGEASEMVPARLGVPFYPAGTVPSRAWPAERCPLCADGIPVTPLHPRARRIRPAQPRSAWHHGGGTLPAELGRGRVGLARQLRRALCSPPCSRSWRTPSWDQAGKLPGRRRPHLLIMRSPVRPG